MVHPLVRAEKRKVDALLRDYRVVGKIGEGTFGEVRRGSRGPWRENWARPRDAPRVAADPARSPAPGAGIRR